MPRLLDSIAISLALSACGPLSSKSGPQTTTPDRIAYSVSATIPLPSIPDGFECKSVQNAVSKEVTRCCLTIAPHKACHEVETGRAEQFSKDNTVDFGGSKVPNYAYFKEGIPPGMYMNYLAHSAKNATDLAAALTAFIGYRDIEGDNLLPPEEIITQGAGDCDNMANLFVDLLGKLGKKNGYDYKAKVLGLDGADHAVAIFLDTDSKWKALDFNLPFKEIRQSGGSIDLYSASQGFQKYKGESDRFFVRNKLGPAGGKGARIDQFIDPETLKPNGKETALAVDLAYNPGIDPDLFLKDFDWRNSELTHIHYKNDTTAYYRKGVFYQLSEPDKVTMYDENKTTTEIQYLDHPTTRFEFFSTTGLLERRDLKNGNREAYSDGVLFQLIFATGPLDYEVYHPSGKIRQKHFRDGKIEWFNEEGQMTHRKDKRGNVTATRYALEGTSL